MWGHPLKIAIVGGGIAGLYCARELGRKHHRVTLYETLDHLGGRIETIDLRGFKAECGPMRFELATQPRFEALAKGLGIKFKNFANPWAEPAEFPKYDLAAHEMSTKQRRSVQRAGTRAYSAMFSHQTSALDLLRFGVFRILGGDNGLTLPQVVEAPKNQKSKIAQLADSLDEENGDYDRLRTDATLGRRWLYTLGLWNALSRVLSPGAVAKIRDTGTFYHLMPENPSASEWLIFWLRLFRSKADLSTIDKGVNTVVRELEKQIHSLPNVEISTSATVTRIFRAEREDKLSLHVDFESDSHTRTHATDTDFDHMVLALPAEPLRSLMQPFPETIKQHLRGVIPFTLLKAFVVFRNPWWEKVPKP